MKNIFVLPELVSNQMPSHWMGLREHDNQKPEIPLFSNRGFLEIPDGFITDGYLDKEIRDNIKAKAIPFKKDWNPSHRKKANALEDMGRELLGVNEVLLLALYDHEIGDWTINFVSIQDLFVEKAEQLLQEGFEAFLEGDFELEASKRHAYLAITGLVCPSKKEQAFTPTLSSTHLNKGYSV